MMMRPKEDFYFTTTERTKTKKFHQEKAVFFQLNSYRSSYEIVLKINLKKKNETVSLLQTQNVVRKGEKT